jgi:predicted amidophosphoribosyltransferase
VNNVVRDVLEVAILVAVGGMLVTVIAKLRRGAIAVVRCDSCHRPTSRAYPNCKHCGTPRAEHVDGRS